MYKYIVPPSVLNLNVRESNNSHFQLQRVMTNEEGTKFKIFDRTNLSNLKTGKSEAILPKYLMHAKKTEWRKGQEKKGS